MAIVLNVSEAWLMGYDVPMERKDAPTTEEKLTESELLLLDLFRQVPEDKQNMVIEMIRVALA
jgi:hypothetical protein